MTADRRDPSQPLTWLRYLWIAGALAAGVALIGCGLLVAIADDLCESECGPTWPWVVGSVGLGAAFTVGALVDAVRTVRRNRRVSQGRRP